MQQYLPFTVLKRSNVKLEILAVSNVATVLTVYGIETLAFALTLDFFIFVATVLTVYGIETALLHSKPNKMCCVATVLTVYGIETH